VQELYIPEDQRLNLLQLNEHTCKWPIGDPLTPDFYFCGQHSDEGKPYCEFHSRRAYHQIDKKRR
jgi:GcrA cell cycle regulator